MARGGGWTTSSSNVSGALSNTSAFTYTLSRTGFKPDRPSTRGCGTTTRNDLTHSFAAELRGDCSDMQKENAISMPKDLAGVVAAWSSLSDDQKAQIIGIAKDNLK
jgi:hypothetical protein